MVASVEETESSASSTSSGRHSAGLPIVGPPRGLFATGLSWRKILFRFLTKTEDEDFPAGFGQFFFRKSSIFFLKRSAIYTDDLHPK